jgi:hypothetical protein
MMKRSNLQFAQLKLLMTNWLECTIYGINDFPNIFNTTTNHGATVCGHSLLAKIGDCESARVKGQTC